jgi:hypothetical protein
LEAHGKWAILPASPLTRCNSLALPNGVESLGSTQSEILRFVPNTISDLDHQLPPEAGLAILWLVSPVQEDDGIGVPSICDFPLHGPSLESHKSLDGHPSIQPTLWAGLTIEHWWSTMTSGSTPNRKAVASLNLLVTSEIWNQRNTRVFHKKHMSPLDLLDHKINK